MAYAPAMHVLIQDRVPDLSRKYMHALITGDALVWDTAPLAKETWAVFAGISSGIAQVVRLFGRQLEFDRWGDVRRLSLATLPWDGLPYDFGWRLACRPFAGVEFARTPSELSPEKGLAYVASWPHGYLTLDELRRFRAPLSELVRAGVGRMLAEEDVPPLGPDEVIELLADPRALTQGQFVDLFGFGGDEDVWRWRTRRALILLRAVDGAIELKKDLFSIGY
jgi:hypothetical protein